MTATYLQNRLPSAPLGGAIPLHRLLPTSSLFSLPPRFFRCVAFVQDHSPSLSKLTPRALKGVFVGYSRTQKGYRVYFPDTRHYMTSANVTFYEDSPFFSPPSLSLTPAAASPLPGFPPLVVVADLGPSVPPPPLSLSPLLLLMFPRFSLSHLLQIPIPYPPTPLPPRHPRSSFPKPL